LTAVALDPLAVYRDDGPLARALGRVLGARLPLPAPALLLAGLAPLLAMAVVAGGDVSLLAAGVVVAWAIVLGGASRGRPTRLATRWAQTPLVRVTEYGGLVWLAAIEGPAAYPAAFALLAALAFRHYDLTYRLRHRGATPAGWVNGLSGGWEARLAAGFALLAAGALPAGFFVAAAVLGVCFAGEAAAGWIRQSGDQRPLDDLDEEDGEP
jgi:Family of unknown function (DUF5941)